MEKIRTGYYQPAEIRQVMPGRHLGKTLDPRAKISDHFKEGDQAVLAIGANFNDTFKPSLGVDFRRSPIKTKFNRYAFSAGSQKAWGDTPPSSRSSSLNSEPSRPSNSSQKRHLRQRKLIPRTLTPARKNSLHEETEASKFRALMRDQQTFSNTFGLMSEEERIELVNTSLEQEFNDMDLEQIITNQQRQQPHLKPASEIRDKIKSVFRDNLVSLNSVFRYYCGFGFGNGGGSAIGDSTATMSLMEFTQFCRHCKFLRDQIDSHLLELVFNAANKAFGTETTAGATAGHILARNDANNPTGELLRYEFFECLVRLAGHRWPSAALSDAFERLVVQYILPRCSNVVDDDFKKQLQRHDVQACIQEEIKDLTFVYHHYAIRDSLDETKAASHGPRPTMNIQEFVELMMDSALLTTEKKKKQNEAKNKAKGRQVLASFQKELGAWKQNADNHIFNDAVSTGAIFGENQKKQMAAVKTFEVKDLTSLDGRVCFSQAQADTDTAIEELEELMFAEFCEALARVANAKWPDPRMPFKDKVHLAVECVIGLKKHIHRQNNKGSVKPKNRKTRRLRKKLKDQHGRPTTRDLFSLVAQAKDANTAERYV